MKKYVVYGMAKSRSAVLKGFSRYSGTLNEHIIKLVVYGDSFRCWKHWCDEVANIIDTCNNVKLKFNGNKSPTTKIIYDTLFNDIGDGDSNDVMFNLKDFRNRLSGQYRYFDIDSTLMNDLEMVYQCIFKEFIPILTQSNSYSLVDIQNKIYTIFERFKYHTETSFSCTSDKDGNILH